MHRLPLDRSCNDPSPACPGQRESIRHGRRKRGFTLIELLVVISIIALLIALLLPALRAARDTAHSVDCLSNERQIGIMFYGYANDFRGWIPPTFFQPYAGTMGYRVWGDMIDAYGGGREGDQSLSDVFKCPAFPDAMYTSNRGAYGMNQAAGVQSGGKAAAQATNYDGSEPWAAQYYNIYLTIVPSDLYLVSDAPGTGTSYTMPRDLDELAQALRHINKTINVLFMDSSARTLSGLVNPAARYGKTLPWVNGSAFSSAYPKPD